MFRKYEAQCRSSAVHGPHVHWDRNWDRLLCRGERKYYPMRPPMLFPKHKHFYRLVNTLITPKGEPVPRHNIYWQCDCWAVYFANRQSVYEELTRKQVYQTWPG